MKLWEILVPTLRDNKPVRTRSHKEWDRRVREISNGLTILKPGVGQWTSPDGELFIERMIPVRIACSKEQIEQIAALTADFYKQIAVMYYLVSEASESKAGFFRQCLGSRRNKVPFDSESQALQSIDFVKTTGKAKRPSRAYLCEVCQKWHLTSKR